MVTYAQLKDMDTSKLASAAANAGDLSGSLAGRGSQVSSSADIPPGMWQGQDATAASGTLQPLDSPLYDVSDSANRGQAALEDLAEKLDKAKEDLNDAVSQAKAHGLTVGPDGTVTTPESNSMAKAEMDAEMAEQIREQIQRAVQDANDADDEASGQLGGEPEGGELSNQKPRGHKSPSDPGIDGIEWVSKKAQETATGLSRAATMGVEFGKDPEVRASAKGISTKLGVVGAGITGGLAALEQAEADARRPSVSTADSIGRAAARGVLQGGAQFGGAIAGAAYGASKLGTKGANIGRRVGGARGAAIGAGVGASAGSMIGGAIGGDLAHRGTKGMVDWIDRDMHSGNGGGRR